MWWVALVVAGGVLYGLALRCTAGVAGSAVGVTVVGAMVVAAVVGMDVRGVLGVGLVAAGFGASLWALGRWGLRGRARRRALAAYREGVPGMAGVAADVERWRYAAELHDTAAHRLTGVAVGASAALRLRDAGLVGEALRHAGEAGRLAVRELGEFPAGETLEEVDALVAAWPIEGVSYRREVDAAPPEVARVAYRVVREALTNALRYAHGAQVHVALTSDGDHVHVEITSGIPPEQSQRSPGAGRIGPRGSAGPGLEEVQEAHGFGSSPAGDGTNACVAGELAGPVEAVRGGRDVPGGRSGLAEARNDTADAEVPGERSGSAGVDAGIAGEVREARNDGADAGVAGGLREAWGDLVGVGGGFGLGGLAGVVGECGGRFGAGFVGGGEFRVRAEVPVRAGDVRVRRSGWRGRQASDWALVALAVALSVGSSLLSPGGVAVLPLFALHAVPLGWRRRAPGWGLAVALAVYPVLLMTGVGEPAGDVFLWSCWVELALVYAMGAYGGARGALGPVGMAVVGGLALACGPEIVGNRVAVWAVLAVGVAVPAFAAWGAGVLAARWRARRRTRLEGERERIGRAGAAAARAERGRIAAGLHGTAVRQAQAIVAAADDGDLEGVSVAARAALASLRELVEELRHVGDAEPPPSLDGIRLLAARSNAVVRYSGRGAVVPPVEVMAFAAARTLLAEGATELDVARTRDGLLVAGVPGSGVVKRLARTADAAGGWVSVNDDGEARVWLPG